MKLGNFHPINLNSGAPTVAQSILQRHTSLRQLTDLLDESPGDCWKRDDAVDTTVGDMSIARYPCPELGPSSYRYRLEQVVEPGHSIVEHFKPARGSDAIQYDRLETRGDLSTQGQTYIVNQNGTLTTL